MKNLVCLLVFVACNIALTRSYCYELQVLPAYDEKTQMFYFTNCTLKDGSTRVPGEQWVDNVKCEKCECGFGCCGFGFALVERRTDVFKDGEQCVPVRLGGCADFKFIKRSNPAVQCEVTAGMA